MTMGIVVTILRCELPHQLIDVSQCDNAHFIVRKIADRMRQFNQRMALHAAAFELMQGRVLENLREDHRRGDAAFFELHCVVHTAQRAGASPADGGSRDIHLRCQFINEFLRRGLGVIRFAANDDFRHAVFFA